MGPDDKHPLEPSDNETTCAEKLADIAESVAKAPAGQQLAIGGLFGWCLGYSFVKAGKAVAITVGGGLIILQVASYSGIIEVNWPKGSRVEDRINRWRKRLERELGVARDPTIGEKIVQFAKDHVYLAGGLAGGFMLGVGSA